VVIKRGDGRQALIEATADVLSRGEDVQIKSIAETAGVSHTLIYRHFPNGGKEEMVAEAYAHIFQGLAKSDIDRLFDVLEAPTSMRESVRDFMITILNPDRAEVRWARLEALAQTRTNPFVADRIEGARQALIESFAVRLRYLAPELDEKTTEGISFIAQALPLGITAIGGPSMSVEQREMVASLWSEAIVFLLESAQAQSSKTGNADNSH
jgi:AcrR family transcriptional regulator